MYLCTGEKFEGKWVRDVMVGGPGTYTFTPEASAAFAPPEGENETGGPLAFTGTMKESILAAKKVNFPIAPPVADLTFHFRF